MAHFREGTFCSKRKTEVRFLCVIFLTKKLRKQPNKTQTFLIFTLAVNMKNPDFLVKVKKIIVIDGVSNPPETSYLIKLQMSF